ncbi:MAG TPA: glycosyltransferase 87 family protein [Candidatus Tumulicola sp.]|nr:glycosyltransferase 87 family protein [Candidatus Tumulicola sp.]
MKRERFASIALAIACTVLPFAGQFYGDRSAGWLMVDFRAYYCAATAAARQENPYFTSSLHGCESAPIPPFYHAPRRVTVPAPYPPYVLMLIYPLTLLPFTPAAIAWWALLTACVVLAAYALSRVTRQPFVVAWAVLALSLGLTTLDSGNVIPISIAALLVAALCTQLGHLYAAAFAIAVAMVEPQIALPAAVAAFIRFPTMRLALALLAGLLAASSLAASGLARNIAYFTTVLPAHALSEVSRDNQYSLATVLAALGVHDRQAALLGGISYIITTVLGIIVGLRLARDYLDPAFAVIIPPAFTLLGGSFVHTGEIAAAAPAALLFFARAQSGRPILLAILILLAVPWMLATSISSFLAPLFPVAYLVYVLGGRARTWALASALASFFAIASLFYFSAHSAGLHPATLVVRPPIDPRLAEASWRSFVLGNSTNRPATWLLRLPTWLGLIAFVWSAVATMRGTPFPAKLARSQA